MLVSAENAVACSCQLSMDSPQKQVTDSYNYSSEIFSGEVIDITAVDEGTLAVKIKVNKKWKGKFAKEITLKTAKDSSMCGYTFEVGKKYLVYASGAKNNISVNNCSRTTIFGDKQEIKFLDKLKKTKGKAA